MINIFKKSKKELITHDGSFHADDIFSAAALSIYLENKGHKFEIIRTRDQKIIDKGDYVFDVGGVYDPDKNRFDHHQTGGAGRREYDPKIEYASFGLVWKKFGIEICGSQKALDSIDKKLVAPVDAHDNGFDLAENKYQVSPYLIQNVFFGMEPTWREEGKDINQVFLKCVSLAKDILSRIIIQTQDALLAEESLISIYKNTQDKRVLVFDKNYPFQNTLHDYPEPIFVVHPRRTNNYWGVKAVREDPKTFKNRKNFPNSWAGLRDEELQRATGVSDAVFCHRGLHMAVAKSKEGAIKLAKLALIG